MVPLITKLENILTLDRLKVGLTIIWIVVVILAHEQIAASWEIVKMENGLFYTKKNLS